MLGGEIHSRIKDSLEYYKVQIYKYTQEYQRRSYPTLWKNTTNVVA